MGHTFTPKQGLQPQHLASSCLPIHISYTNTTSSALLSRRGQERRGNKLQEHPELLRFWEELSPGPGRTKELQVQLPEQDVVESAGMQQVSN